MDGNYKQELLTYIKCNQTYVTLLTNCPFPQCEVHVIYKQCYLPMVGYPLPVTVILPEKLNKNQRAATTIFLTKMGFPRSFPHAIAYACKDCSGIGLHLCGTDQGLHKVLQMLKHTRTKTSIGQVYNFVTQHYQLISRLSCLILQDTHPIPWSTALWYNNLHQFLHLINGQIILKNPWIPIQQQHHDHHIMDDIWDLSCHVNTPYNYKVSASSSKSQCCQKSHTIQDLHCSQWLPQDPTSDISTTALNMITAHFNGCSKPFPDQWHGKDGVK